MSARLGSVVERAAATAARERPARAVRPGWWIYSYGSTDGQWAQVIAIGLLSKGWVRFELRHLDGRRGLVEASPSHPTSCLTASTARRVGITGVVGDGVAAEELVVVTRLAGRKVTAHCELVAMARLRPGDLFLGLDPGQPVMRVQVARLLPAGALAVFDESGTADQRWAAVRRGDVEPGAKPGEGFIPRSTVRVTSVKRVVRFTR